jgi:hypothetical protein
MFPRPGGTGSGVPRRVGRLLPKPTGGEDGGGAGRASAPDVGPDATVFAATRFFVHVAAPRAGRVSGAPICHPNASGL